MVDQVGGRFRDPPCAGMVPLQGTMLERVCSLYDGKDYGAFGSDHTFCSHFCDRLSDRTKSANR
jgi:hypothetical protein